MTDAFWIATGSVLMTTVSVTGTIIISMMQRRMSRVANDTHILVNSNYGVQLKLGMELSEFKALTTKLPEDIQAAKIARHQYYEHMAKQAIMNKIRE